MRGEKERKRDKQSFYETNISIIMVVQGESFYNDMRERQSAELDWSLLRDFFYKETTSLAL